MFKLYKMIYIYIIEHKIVFTTNYHILIKICIHLDILQEQKPLMSTLTETVTMVVRTPQKQSTFNYMVTLYTLITLLLITHNP